METLQSQLSQEMGQSKDQDTGSTGHSTGTASKATGERFGSAKKAKLVVFKMANLRASETASAFDAGAFQVPALVLLTMTVLA